MKELEKVIPSALDKVIYKFTGKGSLVFKQCPVPFSRYQTNKLGQIKGPSGKLLTPHYNNAGYPIIQVIKDNGAHTTTTVSRLVALTWVPNPDPYRLTDVDHISCRTEDCRASNLQWLSHRDNLRKRSIKGGKHAVISIKVASGDHVKYPSISSAAEATGLSYPTVRGICRGEYSLPSAGGYTFVFDEK